MLEKTKKRKKLQNLIRLILLFCAGFAFAVAVANAIVDSNIHTRLTAVQGEADRDLRAIFNHIEFNGLDDTARQKMAEYSEKYTEYSNFIIVDNRFRVLYSLNQGYLDDTGSFYVCLDANRILYVLDADGMIINAFDRVYTSDEATLINFSTPLRSKLQDALEEIALAVQGEAAVVNGYTYSYSGGDRIVVEVDSSANNPNNVSYSGFSTKNMHLFFIRDSINPIYERITQSVDSARSVMEVFVTAAIFAGMAYWMLLSVWVFLDASGRRNNSHPALWSVLTLFTNVTGLIIYLVTRPAFKQCGKCNESMEDQYVVCPVCGAQNREQCAACGRIIDENWNYCPYCTKPIQHRSASVIGMQDG